VKKQFIRGVKKFKVKVTSHKNGAGMGQCTLVSAGFQTGGFAMGGEKERKGGEVTRGEERRHSASRLKLFNDLGPLRCAFVTLCEK